MTSTSYDCDVVVVGGGPAGATAATLLARQGRSVVLLEKSRHPRFHIGESLLPANVALLDRLGVREQVDAIGMPKYGIEFSSPQHEHRVYIDFAEAWDKSMPMAWQVRRSDFDKVLFDKAVATGAAAHEGCRVSAIAFDDDGATVDAVLDDGARAAAGTAAEVRRWRTRLVVDASGRDALVATMLGWKRKNPRHASAALFGHFHGAQRLEGRREGNISIFWFAHGWFWFIPLADGATSVGAVCTPQYLKSRAKPLPEFFADTIALVPGLAERLHGATLDTGKVWATGNYSYDSAHGSNARCLLVGDAFAFVDPVFSSGVYLAMTSAFEAARTAAACLDGDARAAAAARRDYERFLRRGPRAFSWFIHRMTTPAMRHLFMHPQNPLRMLEAVLAVLAGDIYGGSPIGRSLLAFKALYMTLAVAQAPRSLRAWRNRRRTARSGGAVPGENVLPTAAS